MEKKYLLLLLLSFMIVAGAGAEGKYELKEDIYYGADNSSDVYERERCRLDLYYPLEKKGFKTVVWFHGGGLTGGNKHIPESLKEEGIAVVAVNYRLSPAVKSPVFIEDAAASVAWVFKNIGSYGGDVSQIHVSGHSAGGYLTLMLGLDKQWLGKHNVDADRIANLFALSPQVITHFTIRAEQGIGQLQPTVDRYAPLYHVRKDAAPVYLFLGNEELEMAGRYEENLYFWRMMQLVGHPKCLIYKFDGYNHGNMPAPAYPLMLQVLGVKK